MIRRIGLLILLCMGIFVVACAQATDKQALEESLRSGNAQTTTQSDAGR